MFTLRDEQKLEEIIMEDLQKSNESTSAGKGEQTIIHSEEEREKYAHMFPDWDLLPPQIAIRRVTRKN